MNEDLDNIHFSPIRNYKYSQFFREAQYNEKTLSEAERKEFVEAIDETVAQYSEGIPLMLDSLKRTKDKNDTLHEVESVINSVSLFALITMIDSMVACKYFILADKDYDRRFLRGKMRIILNEGFKKLYGFNKETYKKSEWEKLLSLMKYFPESINHQYQELTFYLARHSKYSSWWKKERDLETHMMDAEELYESRLEEIVESKVMMDSMKLFNTFLAVNQFLTNLNACYLNCLIEMYHRGELIGE